jgi:transposase
MGLAGDTPAPAVEVSDAGGATPPVRRGRPAMTYDAAFDTSATTTVVCIVRSSDGVCVLETSAPTDPEALHQVLEPYLPKLRRVGVEAGAWTPWLYRELLARGVPMIVLETRHAAAALAAQRNKTDRNDARGLAQIVRAGWYRTVHVKTEESHKLKLLLAHRRTLKRKLLDIENEVRQSLKVFGLMVGRRVQRGSFEARVRELVVGDPLIAAMTECMLRAWAALWAEYRKLDALLVRAAGADPLCRRFTAIPGVGPVTAVTFKAAVDDPARFRRSKTVGAHFALTPRRIQSGTSVDKDGHISRCGDGDMRTALYEAASAMLTRSHQWSSLKAWGLRISARRGHKRAVVAVARKLAVVMHRMWVDGTDFRLARETIDPATGEVLAA